MKHKTIYSLLLLLSLFTNLEKVSAQDANWTTTSKKITFTIKNAKLPVQGSFEGLMSKIIFDPNNLKASNFSATILVSTIKTGIEMRDKHLKRAEYFNVEKFPEIILKSSEITLLKNNQYTAKCILIIKGISKEINLPFEFIETDKNAVFKGTLNLNRLDFNVGSHSVIMSNNIQVSIVVNAIRK